MGKFFSLTAIRRQSCDFLLLIIWILFYLFKIPNHKKRVSAWSFLNKHISKNFLQKIVNNYEFDDIVKVTKKILQGKIKGRALIKI